MGQAKANLSRIIRQLDPLCVYCCENISTSVDHAPPRNIFTGKDRPKGMEVGCCQACEDGLRDIDSIAASFSRITMTPETELERQEIWKYAKGVVNNQREIAEIFGGISMLTNMGQNLVQVTGDNGKRLHNVMLAFSARMGLSLYRHGVGRIVPKDAHIFARYYGSYELQNNLLPTGLFDILRTPKTLRNGRKEKSKEYLYDYASDEEGGLFMSFSLFRESFACLSIISHTQPPEYASGDNMFRPGFLQGYDWRQVGEDAPSP